MKMAAEHNEERKVWVNAIRVVIAELGNSMRGYLHKAGRFLEAKQVRKVS